MKEIDERWSMRCKYCKRNLFDINGDGLKACRCLKLVKHTLPNIHYKSPYLTIDRDRLLQFNTDLIYNGYSLFLSDKEITPAAEVRKTVSDDIRAAIMKTNIAILGAKKRKCSCVVTYDNREIANDIWYRLTKAGYTVEYADDSCRRLRISWPGV